jgi:hypothetical protein
MKYIISIILVSAGLLLHAQPNNILDDIAGAVTMTEPGENSSEKPPHFNNPENISASTANVIVHARLEELGENSHAVELFDSTGHEINKPAIPSNNEIWISRFSADGKPLTARLNSKGDEVNKELVWINDLIKLSTGRKRDCRVHVLVVSGIPAKQTTNMLQVAQPFWQERPTFSDLNMQNSLTWSKASSKILEEFVAEQAKQSHTELIVYLHNEFHFYHGLDAKSLRKTVLPSLHFYGSTFEGQEEMKDKIKAAFARRSTQTMKGVVKSLISGIETEYLGYGARKEEEKNVLNPNSSNPLCKPINDLLDETWSNAEKGKYHFAVMEAATLYQHHTPEQRIFPHVIVDDPENFSSTDSGERMLGSNYQFITEILPDLLDLLPGNSNDVIDILFTRVGFVIPESQRAKFAQDVRSKIPSALKGNKILMVVPYYSCTARDDNFSKDANGKPVGLPNRVYPFLMMPATDGSNSELINKMNESMTKHIIFRDGFEAAFKHVPKVHLTYVGTVMLNGTVTFFGPIRAQGYEIGYIRYCDLYPVVDSRIEMIIDMEKNCREEYNKMRNTGASMFVNGGVPTLDAALEACFTSNRENARKVLQEHPNPVYKDFGATLRNLKQSELMSKDGESVAYFAILAAMGKYIKKYLNKETHLMEDFEGKRMDNKFFYAGHNPFYESNPIFSAIQKGSFLLGLVGLDFIPDAVGTLTAHIMGDKAERGQFIQGILITGTVMTGLYTSVKAYKLGKQLVKDVAKGKGSLVPLVDGQMVLVSDDIAHLFGAISDDGTDLYLKLGLPDKVIEAAKADRSINQALQDALFTIKDGRLIKSADFANLIAALRDQNVIDLYKVARQTRRDLDFETFLNELDATPLEVRKFDDRRMISSLGDDPATVEAAKHIVAKPGEYNLIVHGGAKTTSDGRDVFWVLRKQGGEWEWVALPHRSAVKYMRGQVGYNTAERVRVYYCGKLDGSLPQNLANKSGKEVVAPDKPIGVVVSEGPTKGDIVTTDSNEGQWWVFKPGESNSTPETSGKIRVAKPEEKVLPLGKGIDDAELISAWKNDEKGIQVLEIYMKNVDVPICAAHFKDGWISIRYVTANESKALDEVYKLIGIKYNVNIVGIEAHIPDDVFQKLVNENLKDANVASIKDPAQKAKAIEGAANEAALATAEGKLAQSKGFGEVESVLPNNNGTIKIKFTKPDENGFDDIHTKDDILARELPSKPKTNVNDEVIFNWKKDTRLEVFTKSKNEVIGIFDFEDGIIHIELFYIKKVSPKEAEDLLGEIYQAMVKKHGDKIDGIEFLSIKNDGVFELAEGVLKSRKGEISSLTDHLEKIEKIKEAIGDGVFLSPIGKLASDKGFLEADILTTITNTDKIPERFRVRFTKDGSIKKPEDETLDEPIDDDIIDN